MNSKSTLDGQINQVLALHEQILQLAEAEEWEPLLDLCEQRYNLCQAIFRHENYENLHNYPDELNKIKRLDLELIESFKPIFSGNIRKIYTNKKQLKVCKEYRNGFSVKY